MSNNQIQESEFLRPAIRRKRKIIHPNLNNVEPVEKYFEEKVDEDLDMMVLRLFTEYVEIAKYKVKDILRFPPSPIQRDDSGRAIVNERRVSEMNESWPWPITGFNGNFITIDHLMRLIVGHTRQALLAKNLKMGRISEDHLIWVVKLLVKDEDIIAQARILSNMLHNPDSRYHLMSEIFPFCKNGSLAVSKAVSTYKGGRKLLGNYWRPFCDRLAALMIYPDYDYFKRLHKNKIFKDEKFYLNQLNFLEFNNMKNEKPNKGNGWRRIYMDAEEFKVDLNPYIQILATFIKPGMDYIQRVYSWTPWTSTKEHDKCVKAIKEIVLTESLAGRIDVDGNDNTPVGILTFNRFKQTVRDSEKLEDFKNWISEYGKSPKIVGFKILDLLNGRANKK